jgi:hypothetical protein
VIHYNYSPTQLEAKAEELLRKFDSERLTKIKPIDVYEVIERCLDVPYDWKYITPDQSVLGLTAFKSGTLWVWPEPHYEEGMKPMKIFLEEGTILIDSTLTESDNQGPENFTVMHEVFHQVLHKRCFRHANPDYTHATTKKALQSHRRLMTSLEICEYQANACASAFLMPRGLLSDTLRHYHMDYTLNFDNQNDRHFLVEIANEFSVSKTAMKYRMINLGMAYEEHWN